MIEDRAGVTSTGCPICGTPSASTFDGYRFVSCPSCGDFAFSYPAGLELQRRPDLHNLALNHVKFAQSDGDVALFTWKRGTARLDGKDGEFAVHFGWIAREKCR